jgi:spore coat protein A, manganese oxidase
MSITRQEFLKFAGGAAIALPLSSLAASSCDRRLSLAGTRKSQIVVKPFQVPLPISPILQPIRSDRTTDYYEITQKEAQVEILPGLQTTIWGYNGIFPGPTIAARRGRKAVVRHRNELPVPTVVHLHGGKTPPESDGYPTDLILPIHATNTATSHTGHIHTGHTTVDGIGQGFKDYTYPNQQRGATLWYHDHRDMFTGPQVYRGLAGFYIVHDAIEDELPLPKEDRDIPLMITDHIFNEDGSFFYPSLDPTLKEEGLENGYHEGVQGDTILVNGAPFPFLEVSNTRYRFRFLNASNRRIYRLAIDPPPAEGAMFVQIGSDGGLVSAPIPQADLLIAPAERFDVVIDFSRYPVGTQIVLKNLDGNGSAAQVMRFDVVRSRRDDSAIPAQLASDAEPLDPAQATVTRRVLFSRAGKRFRINGKEFDPNRVEFRPQLNSIEIWEVLADIPHPFHMHLAHLQVLSRNNQKPAPYDRGWKDTVNVGARQMVRLIAHFAPYRGKYIYHCHMLEHEDLGMMDNFEVT